jgi:hypothetical protein
MKPILSDYGLCFQSISRHPPFCLIQCPLCGSTDFTSLEGASVWCDCCNARFTVDYTCGDPGFTVRCTWDHYDRASSAPVRYLLPRWPDAHLSLTLKDSGDLLDLRPGASCPDDCRRGSVRLTDGSSGLRAGLHACHVGTLYDWRLVGRTPADPDDDRFQWEVGGVRWPESAIVHTNGFTEDERSLLHLAGRLMQRDYADAATRLNALADRPAERLPIFMADLPSPARLKAGQAYLLHHWAVRPPNTPFDPAFALPVWYTVTRHSPDQDPFCLEVLSANICPVCGEAVTPDQWAEQEEWESHATCRRLWRESGWQPLRNPESAEASHA